MHELSDGELEQLAAAARAAALGELMRGVLHAANNALFAMLANVELVVADAALDPETTERLGHVRDSGESLRELLRRLGGVARDDSPPGVAHLDDAVRDVSDLLRRTGCVQAVDERLPDGELPVRGGAGEVAQIVLHAMLHAASLAGRTGRLAVAVESADGAHLLRIEAGGQPVARADGSFGLAVAQELVRRLGGTLAVDGASTLALSLPAA